MHTVKGWLGKGKKKKTIKAPDVFINPSKPVKDWGSELIEGLERGGSTVAEVHRLRTVDKVDLIFPLLQNDSETNTDVDHAGLQLVDRDNRDYLNQKHAVCPHLPSFNSILENFDPFMPKPRKFLM
eukprot:GHVP01005596.1.p1 GENE.GHVP01005596.1~~GHVP01005596.1.p1  ORF type:complete len:142 (-),score=16.45 GHVP01005596.1:50-427(-)